MTCNMKQWLLDIMQVKRMEGTVAQIMTLSQLFLVDASVNEPMKLLTLLCHCIILTALEPGFGCHEEATPVSKPGI